MSTWHFIFAPAQRPLRDWLFEQLHPISDDCVRSWLSCTRDEPWYARYSFVFDNGVVENAAAEYGRDGIDWTLSPTDADHVIDFRVRNVRADRWHDLHDELGRALPLWGGIPFELRSIGRDGFDEPSEPRNVFYGSHPFQSRRQIEPLNLP